MNKLLRFPIMVLENVGDERYLWWYHPPTHDENIWPSKGVELLDELRN